jgi:hypothetical protein
MLSELSEEEQKNVRAIMEWANRMTKKHGVCLYDDNTVVYNWMTALCRELYGEDWQEYMMDHGITCPDINAVAMAEKWENGEIPDWIHIPNEEEKDTSPMIILEEDLGEKI